jgi:hypothetical protein
MGNLEDFYRAAWQKTQFESTNLPGKPTVLDALANPPASGVTAQAKTIKQERDEGFADYTAGHPQFEGHFGPKND